MATSQKESFSTSKENKESSEPCLNQYISTHFQRGRSAWIEALWICVQQLYFCTAFPGSSFRCFLLKIFGAKVGKDVVVKPRVRLKFPWKLVIGDYSWVGEGVWIDNLTNVTIGRNCCISQEAYLCSGNHDWSKISFNLKVEPIVISDGVWIGAKSIVGPGVNIGKGAVLGLGSVATNNLNPWTIYKGNPALPVKERKIREKV